MGTIQCSPAALNWQIFAALGLCELIYRTYGLRPAKCGVTLFISHFETVLVQPTMSTVSRIGLHKARVKRWFYAKTLADKNASSCLSFANSLFKPELESDGNIQTRRSILLPKQPVQSSAVYCCYIITFFVQCFILLSFAVTPTEISSQQVNDIQLRILESDCCCWMHHVKSY